MSNQIRRLMLEVFPRDVYRGDGNPSIYYPREREKIAKLAGGAIRVVMHGRLYSRSAQGVVDWAVMQGCYGTQLPAEQPRLFSLSITGAAPALPWNSTNMANLPDDGTWLVNPTMGMVDFQLKVSGGANTWVEFGAWATLEFAS